jgi:hypothetical protein
MQGELYPSHEDGQNIAGLLRTIYVLHYFPSFPRRCLTESETLG